MLLYCNTKRHFSMGFPARGDAAAAGIIVVRPRQTASKVKAGEKWVQTTACQCLIAAFAVPQAPDFDERCAGRGYRNFCVVAGA
jgi:hypothetical protein